MSDLGPGPDGFEADPLLSAAEALTDLAALLRGGGRVGADPRQLASLFAASLLRVTRQAPARLHVHDEGLYLGDQPLWAGDLLARRVAASLRAQGLEHVAIDGSALPSAVAELGVLLARDWDGAGDDALERAAEARQLAGVVLGFGRAVPEALGGGQEPGVLLGQLRVQGGAARPELAPALARIRQALELRPDVAGAIAGASLGARQRLEPEIKAIEEGRDIGAERLGRLVFELMRLDTAGLQAADSFRLVLDHYDHMVAANQVDQAYALIRRALTLADPVLVPDWPHRKLIEAELGALFESQALRRLVSAANASSAPIDAWRRLLFVLGQVMPLDKASEIAQRFAELEQPLLRQAVADGLALACGRDVELLGNLLQRTEGIGQAIVMLAIGRLDAPTLLEKLLARMDSDSDIVRQAAMVALRRHRSPRTQAVVRKALGDRSAGVRVEALRYVSVYRDAEAAALILERLRGLGQGQAELDEQRALGMAFALITRQEGVLPLTRVAQEAGEARSDAANAAIIGLASLGASGRSALSGLARTSPELRRLVHAAGVTE